MRASGERPIDGETSARWKKLSSLEDPKSAECVSFRQHASFRQNNTDYTDRRSLKRESRVA